MEDEKNTPQEPLEKRKLEPEEAKTETEHLDQSGEKNQERGPSKSSVFTAAEKIETGITVSMPNSPGINKNQAKNHLIEMAGELEELNPNERSVELLEDSLDSPALFSEVN